MSSHPASDRAQRAPARAFGAVLASALAACGGLADSSGHDASSESLSPDVAIDAPLDATPPYCFVSGDTTGWLPRSSGTTSDLDAVSGSSARDVWAVGTGGTIVHWDGTTWAASPTKDGANLAGVWAWSADDAWAVGARTNGAAAIHWDGTAWSSVTLPRLTARAPALHGVWGSAPDDVWAVGEDDEGLGALLLHWDGSSWSSMAAPAVPGGMDYELHSVGGNGARDVWAVGTVSGGYGYLLHWDGMTWSAQPASSSQIEGSLAAVWVDGEEDAWSVGQFFGEDEQASFVARWNGRSWGSSLPSGGRLWDGNPSPHPALRGVWGSAPDDVWAVGPHGAVYVRTGNAPGPATLAHWDGHGWSASGSCPTKDLSAVWGSGPDDVWAVGAGGLVLHHS